MTARTPTASIVLLGLLTAGLAGQSAPGAAPTFDVASIKPNRSGGGGIDIRFLPGGRFVAANIFARELIRIAYQMPQLLNVVGGPAWLDGDRFDVEATAGGTPSVEQMLPMIQMLLAERFKLVAHVETRPLPVYALVLARRDGSRGAQLRPFVGQCAITQLPSGGPPAAPSLDGAVHCGLHFESVNTNGMRVTGEGATIEQLTKWMPLHVYRTVIDRTGLMGRFDLQFEFTRRGPGRLEDPATAGQPAADSGTSIFTAVEEQLGLELDSQTAPLDVVVVDSVERPTAN